MDIRLSIVDELIGQGISRSKVPLTENLRHYLSVTVVRYMTEHVSPDGLTLRWFQAVEEGLGAAVARRIADDCLLSCAFFSERLMRQGSVRHYVGIGQDAYEAASLMEQAVSFPHMLGVLIAIREDGRPDGALALELLRSGVRSRQAGLENVVPFQRAGPRR